MHLSKLIKPIEYTTQRVNLNATYGLNLIVIYQYWLINCNKCCNCTNMRMLKIGETRAKEDTWHLLYFFHIFFYKAKQLRK